MTLTKPTLVIFDLDDTLYPYEPSNEKAHRALVVAGARETGLPEAKFDEVLSESRLMVKSRLGKTGASHSRLLYIHEALNRLGFANQPALSLALEQTFWREYLLSMQLRVGAEELLLSLRFNHIPIALVTDLTLQIQLRKLNYLKLDAFFDAIVASEETSGDKLTLEPFKTLAQRVEPAWLDNVWFVGDHEFDAPVSELQELGVIRNGVSWIKKPKHGGKSAGWSHLEEIENALNKCLEA